MKVFISQYYGYEIREDYNSVAIYKNGKMVDYFRYVFEARKAIRNWLNIKD
jgi:hypothetical protein